MSFQDEQYFDDRPNGLTGEPDPNGFELPEVQFAKGMDAKQISEALAMSIVHNLGEMYGASVELRQRTNDKAIDWVMALVQAEISKQKPGWYIRFPMDGGGYMEVEGEWAWKEFVRGQRHQAQQELLDELEAKVDAEELDIYDTSDISNWITAKRLNLTKEITK